MVAEMTSILGAHNIFIDTEYFDSINYDFNKAALKELVRHVKNGRAKIILTSVTLGEMRAHLAEGVSKAEQALKRFRSDGRMLRNLPELPIQRSTNWTYKMSTRDCRRKWMGFSGMPKWKYWIYRKWHETGRAQRSLSAHCFPLSSGYRACSGSFLQ